MEEMNRKADAVFMTETLFDGQTEQGVELDHVLPDYYPEIFRILKCCLSPRVISAAVSGNKIMLDGVVLIKVLYLAENSTALHCVEQRYTWSKTVDIAGKAENLCGEPRITAVPRTDYCNCRAVSSRRLDIRGAISCRITVTCPAKFTLPALPDGMQVLTREVSCCTEPIYADKQLAVREDIETGAPGIDYIISCDAVPRIDDLRVIANKAVVKGTVSISALYGVHTDEHSGCDELEKMTADIPVSQILDMPGLSDQHSCTPEFIVRNCELVPKSDSGVISCELKMECRCSAVQTSTVAIPCDAYSTEYETELTTASLKIPTDQRRADSQTSVKSTVACDGGEVDSIWDCRGELCSVSCRPDGENGLLVTGQVCMTVIGKCAGGTPFVAEKQEAFEHTIPAANVTPDTSVNCRASVSNTGFAIRSDGSVDVTVQADISAELTDSRQFSVISSAAVHQDKPKERSDEFALRICYTTGHESCWDIAKRCGTTVESVMEENEIADRSAELSGMVVIPIV